MRKWRVPNRAPPSPLHLLARRRAFTEVCYSNAEISELVKAYLEEKGEGKKDAILKLRAASKLSWSAREAMADFGAVPVLLHSLESHDNDIVEAASTALFNLAWEMDLKGFMGVTGVIKPLVEVMMMSGKTEVARANALGALCSLAVEPTNRETLRALNVGPFWLKILQSKNENVKTKKDAAMGLANLAMNLKVRRSLVEQNTIEIVLGLLNEGESAFEVACILLLANLARTAEGCERILYGNGVEVLAGALEYGSMKGREYAISALLLVASSKREALEAVREEVVLVALQSIVDQGTTRGKGKAASLLKLIRIH